MPTPPLAPSPRPAAVLFDLGGVLADVDLDRMRARFVRETGVSGARLDEELFGRGLKERLDRGTLTPEELAGELAQRLRVPISADAFQAIWEEVLSPRADADALALRVARTVPAALLSNTDPVHHAWALRSLESVAAFRAQVVSYRVRALKPEPAIYEAAIEAMGVEPAELLFVDDLQANVDAARRAGIDAHVVRSAAELEAVLRSCGLGPQEVP